MESIKHEVHRETALQVPCRDSFCVEVSDDRQHEKRCRRALRASVSRLPDRVLARFRWTYRTSIFVAADTKDTVPCSACASRASRFNLATPRPRTTSRFRNRSLLRETGCCSAGAVWWRRGTPRPQWRRFQVSIGLHPVLAYLSLRSIRDDAPALASCKGGRAWWTGTP